MRKISVVLIILFAWIGVKAQSPVIVTQPYKFQKWVHVAGSLFSDSTLLNTDSTNRVATTAWVKRNGGGSGGSFINNTKTLQPLSNFHISGYGAIGDSTDVIDNPLRVFRDANSGSHYETRLGVSIFGGFYLSSILHGDTTHGREIRFLNANTVPEYSVTGGTTWIPIVNLGNSDLTQSDPTRTFTVGTGTLNIIAKSGSDSTAVITQSNSWQAQYFGSATGWSNVISNNAGLSEMYAQDSRSFGSISAGSQNGTTGIGSGIVAHPDSLIEIDITTDTTSTNSRAIQGVDHILNIGFRLKDTVSYGHGLADSLSLPPLYIVKRLIATGGNFVPVTTGTSPVTNFIGNDPTSGIFITSLNSSTNIGYAVEMNQADSAFFGRIVGGGSNNKMGFHFIPTQSYFENSFNHTPLNYHSVSFGLLTDSSLVPKRYVDSVATGGGGSAITALTGDGTATGPGSAALTLATVNSNVGSFGDATHSGTFTVNAKGLVTAASSTAITFPVTLSNSVALTNKDLTGAGNTFPTFNQNTSGTAANVTATSNSTLTTLSALSLPYTQVTGTPSALPPSGSAGGELAGTYPNPTLLNSAVIGKVLTGYTSGSGTVASTDNLLQAIQKLNGNDGLKAPIASPTFTGTVTMPTPFILGSTSVTSTGTQLNYLASATGTTGTTSTNVVFSTSPTLTTPTFTTNATTPILYGGSGTTSTLTFVTTSGTGATGEGILFKYGTNGGSLAGQINHNGLWSIGPFASFNALLDVTSGNTIAGFFSNSGNNPTLKVIATQGSSYTGDLITGSSTQAAGTGYNLMTLKTGNFGTTQFTARGDGLFTANTGLATTNGNLTLGTAGNEIKITEGTNGTVGQVALVSGTKAITITGITTSSRAFVTLVTPSGTSLTTQYQAVCTANTLTLQANVAAGTINIADGSLLNYWVIN